MTKPPGFLPDLQMPLRDAVRGVAMFADATEDALEPAARLLPEPIRSRVQSAMKSLEHAGRRMVSVPLDAARIAAAQAFVRSGGEAAGTAQVFCHAWDHLQERGVAHQHHISETLLADALGRQSGQTDADRPARIVIGVLGSSAIGRMPGLSRSPSTAERDEIVLALAAIVIWLMSERARTLEEEDTLLDLSLALVLSMRADLLAAAEDASALSRALETAAEHL